MAKRPENELPADADGWEPPNGHEKITNRTLGFLTVTENGKLYWKERQVQVEQETKLVFGLLSGALAIAVAVASIVVGLVTVNNEFCIIDSGKSCKEAKEQEEQRECVLLNSKDGHLSLRCPK